MSTANFYWADRLPECSLLHANSLGELAQAQADHANAFGAEHTPDGKHAVGVPMMAAYVEDTGSSLVIRSRAGDGYLHVYEDALIEGYQITYWPPPDQTPVVRGTYQLWATPVGTYPVIPLAHRAGEYDDRVTWSLTLGYQSDTHWPSDFVIHIFAAQTQPTQTSAPELFDAGQTLRSSAVTALQDAQVATARTFLARHMSDGQHHDNLCARGGIYLRWTGSGVSFVAERMWGSVQGFTPVSNGRITIGLSETMDGSGMTYWPLVQAAATASGETATWIVDGINASGFDVITGNANGTDANRDVMITVYGPQSMTVGTPIVAVPGEYLPTIYDEVTADTDHGMNTLGQQMSDAAEAFLVEHNADGSHKPGPIPIGWVEVDYAYVFNGVSYDSIYSVANKSPSMDGVTVTTLSTQQCRVNIPAAAQPSAAYYWAYVVSDQPEVYAMVVRTGSVSYVDVELWDLQVEVAAGGNFRLLLFDS